ncbi:MAG: flagellar biosynthetic protein FliR [Pseudobdellovibrionaceae bacterium]
MPNLYLFSETEILAFALIFVRILAFVATWPILGGETVPVPVKILLSLTLSICLFPIITMKGLIGTNLGEEIIFLTIKEVVIGLCIGFLTRTVLMTVSVAGNLMSYAMGLSQAQIFNPGLGSMGNVIEQYQSTLAAIVFLSINGHHYFLMGMTESFVLAPISAQGISFAHFQSVANLGQEIIFMGLKMSAPLMIAIFLTNVAMGIVGRAVPQINVLITSIPVTISIGLLVMFLTIPLFVNDMGILVNVVTEQVFAFMKAL